MSTAPVSGPNPAFIFETINSYQRSAALKAAIELDIFTQISNRSRTAKNLANSIGATERGVRILCDYLVITGLLTKDRDEYSSTADSAMFLDRNSPACLAGTTGFLLNPEMTAPFANLAGIIRAGLPHEGTTGHDSPIWVEFARHMAPMAWPTAMSLAEMAGGDGEMRVLDIAAGHGLYGISIAQKNPRARVTAVDWRAVLEVARENARRFGVEGRHSTIEGDAFDVEFGGPYDLALVTNFFHHFDPPACETLMRKILAALAPGGRCATVEFIPNEDRVSPPMQAGFAMIMLGTTPAGDAYTLAQYESMFRHAGFSSTTLRALPYSPQSVLFSRKD